MLTFVPRLPSVFSSIVAAAEAMGGAGAGGGGATAIGIETGALKPRLAPMGIPMLSLLSLFVTHPHAAVIESDADACLTSPWRRKLNKTLKRGRFFDGPQCQAAWATITQS